MKPERWQQIKEALAGALEKAPEDRRAYLDRSCPDPDLRREVESLIAAQEQGGSNFLESPSSSAGPLHPGTKLGPYEIVSPIGAGAMGEVYRARDPKLRRDVAIKVLPPAFVNAPHRLARFQREARLLASLNHPNIAAIHGFEDSGGAHALVMELVEGPTLADRIAQGPIPMDEALPIAKQIAEGLEYAHEHGIVHRDLKPANIKAAPDGTVKILDFGLGKAMETGLSPDMGDSPTVSQMATQEGALLGTATYMSPEQAKGRPVDRRADIWAFGCVLYEMLTGKLAFPGESVTEALAAVLNSEPDWSQLPAATPLPVRALLRRCLQKDLRQRLQAIGDARIAIEEYLANPSDASLPTSAAVASALPLWRRALPWSAAGTFALVALAVALFSFRRAPAIPAPSVANLEFNMGNLNLVATGAGSRIAISPDGRKMVFLATGSGSQTTQLYLRSMDSESITPIPGTQGAAQPFFSPDGQWVGFSVNEKLEKVSLAGGLPVTLCDASGTYGVAATWADNGSIYFVVQGKVERVPEGGGTPQPVAAATDPDKLPYRYISSLPGSSGLLLVASGSGNTKFDIDVLSLKTGKSKRLIDGGSWPRYLSSGQIVYAQFSSMGGTSGFTSGLLAVPFDLKRLAVTSSTVPVTEGVFVGNGGAGFYDLAADGTLVYFPGGATADKKLAWLDSKDKIEPLPAPPGNYSNLSVSPDGKRVALTVTGSSQDIYIYNLTRGTMRRLTFEGSNDRAIFTPDGSRVIYSSTGPNGGAPNLWMRRADGSGNAERLTTSKFSQMAASVSPDGKLLAYAQQNPQTGWDIYVMPLEGDRKPQGFLHAPYDEVLPMFSPDGKWIAYMSDESGDYDIYVQAFPGPGGKRQISTGGGSNPVWSRDGKKLYYNYGNNLMDVNVTTRPTFSAGTPRLVSANLGIFQVARNFDVASDGRILLAQRVQQSEQGSSQLHVVLNFATEVQNRLHAAKQ